MNTYRIAKSIKIGSNVLYVYRDLQHPLYCLADVIKLTDRKQIKDYVCKISSENIVKAKAFRPVGKHVVTLMVNTKGLIEMLKACGQSKAQILAIGNIINKVFEENEVILADTVRDAYKDTFTLMNVDEKIDWCDDCIEGLKEFKNALMSEKLAFARTVNSNIQSASELAKDLKQVNGLLLTQDEMNKVNDCMQQVLPLLSKAIKPIKEQTTMSENYDDGRRDDLYEVLCRCKWMMINGVAEPVQISIINNQIAVTHNGKQFIIPGGYTWQLDGGKVTLLTSAGAYTFYTKIK